MATNKLFESWFNKGKERVGIVIGLDPASPGSRSYTQTVVIPPVNGVGEINHYVRKEPNFTFVDDMGEEFHKGILKDWSNYLDRLFLDCATNSFNAMVEQVLAEEEESITLQISLAI